MYCPVVNAQDGSICASVLAGSDWSPLYTLKKLLLALQSLLADPNVDSPLNAEAASLYSENESDAEPYWTRVDTMHQHNMDSILSEVTAPTDHAPPPAKSYESPYIDLSSPSSPSPAPTSLPSSSSSRAPPSLLACARRWATAAKRGTFGKPYQLHADQQEKLLSAVRARVAQESTATSSSSQQQQPPPLSPNDEMRMHSILPLIITSPQYFSQLYAMLPRPRARQGAAAAATVSHTSQVISASITCSATPSASSRG